MVKTSLTITSRNEPQESPLCCLAILILLIDCICNIKNETLHYNLLKLSSHLWKHNANSPSWKLEHHFFTFEYDRHLFTQSLLYTPMNFLWSFLFQETEICDGQYFNTLHDFKRIQKQRQRSCKLIIYLKNDNIARYIALRMLKVRPSMNFSAHKRQWLKVIEKILRNLDNFFIKKIWM